MLQLCGKEFYSLHASITRARETQPCVSVKGPVFFDLGGLGGPQLRRRERASEGVGIGLRTSIEIFQVPPEGGMGLVTNMRGAI